MARILFLLDFEPGHLLPTFAMAESLVARDHEVVFAGIPAMEAAVCRRGLTFQPIFDGLYQERSPTEILSDGRAPTDHLQPLIDGSALAEIETLQPDLVISSYFLAIENLILWYRYRLPLAIFTPFLRPPSVPPSNQAAQNFLELGVVASKIYRLAESAVGGLERLDQLTAPLDQWPELLVCSPALDFPDEKRQRTVRYVGPSVPVAAEKPSWPFPEVGEKKLIYVSLGTQTHHYQDKAQRLFDHLFNFMRGARDDPWQFLISLPKNVDVEALGGVPENAWAESWIPQLAALERADAMITHGGLGSIKESIYFATPMLVLPLDRDQPQNAERVAHHKVGLNLDRESVTSDQLDRAVRQLLTDPNIHSAIQAMSADFQHDNVRGDVLEEILSGLSVTR